MFSRRNSIRTTYCQSWRDLTAAEVSVFSAEKTRATCHLDKKHRGDHEDKILGLAWGTGGWPRPEVYPIEQRTQDVVKVEPVDINKNRRNQP